jgi:hypothetical protein
MHFKNILLIGCTAIVFISCGSNDKKETTGAETKNDTGTVTNEGGPDHIHTETERPLTTAQKLEGAWEIVRATGTAAEMNVGTMYTFEGDKLTFGKGGFNNPGKTEITDSTFSFQAEGNEYKFMYNYSFNGDTLVVSMQNSNGQMLYMLKK